jgi:hypothetical protein
MLFTSGGVDLNVEIGLLGLVMYVTYEVNPKSPGPS